VRQVGARAAVDFPARMTLEGEALTQADEHALLAATGGLIGLRGRWVDGERLTAVVSEIECTALPRQSN